MTRQSIEQARWASWWFYGALVLTTVALLYPADLAEPLGVAKVKVVSIPIDLVVHATLFFLLYWLGARMHPRSAERGLSEGIAPRKATVLFVLLMAYGLLMELLQSLLPERGPSMADLIADAIGCGLAGMIWIRWKTST